MIVFLVTFASPHTAPLAVELLKYYKRVVFIQTVPMTDERKKLGYAKQDEKIEYYNLWEQREACLKIIDEADEVILSCGQSELVQQRLDCGKSVCLCYERIFKKGFIKWLDPRTWKLRRFCHRNRKNKLYLLAMGKFAAKDFRKLGLKKERIYSFGYFPKCDFESSSSARDSSSVLWVGRMVDFKRPLFAVKALKGLNNVNFTMIGDGALFEKTKRYAQKISSRVTFTGSLSNAEVRDEMAKSQILLITSDKGEGWGAVVNEAMSAGCAIVCSDKCGCAGTIVNDKNARIYKTKSIKDLRNKLLSALNDFDNLHLRSLETMEIYNPQVAAKRVYELFTQLNNGKDTPYLDGPCSRVYK